MNLLKGLNIKGRLSHNEPFSRHTTFRIGGPAKIWAQPEGQDDLATLLEISKGQGMPVFLIGGGSNLLVSEEGLNIMAVSLRRAFNFFKITKGKILCGAGCDLQKFILETLKCGYAGLSFMAGIPGTVGGAIKMNAGAGLEGPWISKFIERLKVMDEKGNIKLLEKSDLEFGYRRSNLRHFIILEAEFNLEGPKDKDALLNEYKKFLAEKRNKQELTMPSAGCVFKNPGMSGLNAARLIDECGLKGKTMGGAMVSAKHANFIVNLGKATFKDVINLIDLIKEEVLKKFDVELETEIEILQ